MKHLSSAVAVIVLSVMMIAGCGKKTDTPGTGDTAANMTDSANATNLNVDSNRGGVESVSAAEKTFDFDGTPTAVDKSTMMVTINHEAINDYKAAGSNQFKLADSGMVEFIDEVIKQKAAAHFTVQVIGDQAIIKEWEDVGDVDVDNAAGGTGGGANDTAVVKRTDSVK